MAAAPSRAMSSRVACVPCRAGFPNPAHLFVLTRRRRRGSARSTASGRATPADHERRRAFTLVELLTVVVILGLLSALIFPSLAAARNAANRARTKVQFNQWAAAIEAYRAEYGSYPQFAASGKVNAGAAAGLGGDHLFHDLLAGRHRDGSALAPGADPKSAAAQNPKLSSFLSFAGSEFTSGGLLQDAFGNTDIAVVVDADLDGLIKPGTDVEGLPAVRTLDGSMATPSSADLPGAGVRAGVIFYSADPRATAANPAFVFSWK